LLVNKAISINVYIYPDIKFATVLTVSGIVGLLIGERGCKIMSVTVPFTAIERCMACHNFRVFAEN